jgi:hypothetical protein
MREKIFSNLAYVSLALCIIGNITVGWYFMLAQSVYLIANLTNVIRDFVLNYPIPDKVRDIVFLAITIGLIILKMF